MALVTCNQLTEAIANLWAELNNETMWVQGGRLFLQQGDGRVIQTDLAPGMGVLFDQLSVCNTWFQGGAMATAPRRYADTDVLATCQGLYTVWSNLNDRINTLPVDVYVNGLHSYNPSTKILTLKMSDDTVVDIPLTDLFGDVMETVQSQLRDCTGALLPADTQVATCAQLSAAIGTALDDVDTTLQAYQPLLQNPAGAALPGGTRVYSTTETNTAINTAIVAATSGLQPSLRNCGGSPLAGNTQVPTCAEMNAAIATALSGLPTEVHLTSGSYVSGTKTLDLVLTDNSHVLVPLAQLVADSAAAVPQATLTEVVDGTGTKVVGASVAKGRLDIAVLGQGAASNRPVKTQHSGVAIGARAGEANTVNTSDTVIGREALRNYNAAVMTIPQGANTVIGAEALRDYTNATTTNVEGGMVAVGFQAGLRVTGGERSVLVGPAVGSSVNSSFTTASDCVFIGAGAGQYGDPSVVSSLTVRGDVSIGRYAGARMYPSPSAKQSGVYLGFNAGQVPYAQSANTENVYVGAGAGSVSMGGAAVALGNGAYQGGLGAAVTAVGYNAGRNNTSSNSTYLGANTRTALTIAGTSTVDTTNAIQRDAFGDYIALPPGALTPGAAYVLKFFTAPGGTGSQMVGVYAGTAESPTVLRLPVRSVSAPVGSVPYDPGAVQSVELSALASAANSTAVGHDTVITDANTVYLGNADVTAVRSEGVFYSAGAALTSDARLKTEVANIDLVAAKLFVKGLRFVSYTKHANFIAKRKELEQHLQFAKEDKNTAKVQDLTAKLAAFDEDEAKGAGRKEAGLIAQEVRTLALTHGFGYVVSEDSSGVLSLDYNSIQAIINAVLVDALA